MSDTPDSNIQQRKTATATATAVPATTPKGIMKSQRTSAASTQSQVLPGFAPAPGMGAGTPYSVDNDTGSLRYPFPDVTSKHRFKSYRLKGEYEKPWLTDPAMKKTKWNNVIVGTFMLLGVAAAGVICWFTVAPYRQGEVSPHSSSCILYDIE